MNNFKTGDKVKLSKQSRNISKSDGIWLGDHFFEFNKTYTVDFVHDTSVHILDTNSPLHHSWVDFAKKVDFEAELERLLKEDN